MYSLIWKEEKHTWNCGSVALKGSTQHFMQRNTLSCTQTQQRKKSMERFWGPDRTPFLKGWTMCGLTHVFSFFFFPCRPSARRGALCLGKESCWGYKARGGAKAAARPLWCPSLNSRHRRSVGKTQAGIPGTGWSLSNNSHRVQINITFWVRPAHPDSALQPSQEDVFSKIIFSHLIAKTKGDWAKVKPVYRAVLTEMRCADWILLSYLVTLQLTYLMWTHTAVRELGSCRDVQFVECSHVNGCRFQYIHCEIQLLAGVCSI